MAWKLSRKFENSSRQSLHNVLTTITNIIKGSLEGGTFSDSVGSSDEIEDFLNDSDDIQEMKFQFEVTRVCSKLVARTYSRAVCRLCSSSSWKASAIY